MKIWLPLANLPPLYRLTQDTMFKKVSKDAFIAPFIENYSIDTTDPKLKEKFIEMYRPHIEELWELFMADIAIEKVAIDHPLLKTKLEDTPLSNRAKNCLRFANVKIAADITVYSLTELAMFRNMGKKTLMEIEEYMKEVLG